jgi:hypothetical protein
MFLYLKQCTFKTECDEHNYRKQNATIPPKTKPSSLIDKENDSPNQNKPEKTKEMQKGMIQSWRAV